MYLLPTYLFPVLQRSSTPYDANFTDLDLGLELVGIEYDPRSIILNLSTCFLEVCETDTSSLAVTDCFTDRTSPAHVSTIL